MRRSVPVVLIVIVGTILLVGDHCAQSLLLREYRIAANHSMDESYASWKLRTSVLETSIFSRSKKKAW